MLNIDSKQDKVEEIRLYALVCCPRILLLCFLKQKVEENWFRVGRAGKSLAALGIDYSSWLQEPMQMQDNHKPHFVASPSH